MAKRKQKKASHARKNQNGSAKREIVEATSATEAPTPKAPTPEAVAIDVVAAVVEQIVAAVTGDEGVAEEKRACPRVSLAVEINFASESHFYAGLSGDLSEGGVFVETYRELPIGSEVALEFSLPNGTVTTQGSVRWHRDASDSSPPGIGIAFDDLSADEKNVVHAFCKARAPLYYEIDQAS